MPKFPTYPDCFDECKQITITDLRRLGFLGPGAVASGSYRWTRGGKPSGSVSITTNMLEKFVQLDYCFNDGDPISYRIRLESLPKHFGGCEFYFICPATGKRDRQTFSIAVRLPVRNVQLTNAVKALACPRCDIGNARRKQSALSKTCQKVLRG
jgi:hypothetical protein